MSVISSGYRRDCTYVMFFREREIKNAKRGIGQITVEVSRTRIFTQDIEIATKSVCNDPLRS